MRTGKLSVFFLLLVVVLSAQAQFTYITENGAITIIVYTGTNAHVVIPDTITGLPVTDIGDTAVYDNTIVARVTMPDSGKSIGNLALYQCASLNNITIGSGVTSIGNCAFCGCRTLASATIPNSVKSIGNCAFSGC